MQTAIRLWGIFLMFCLLADASAQETRPAAEPPAEPKGAPTATLAGLTRERTLTLETATPGRLPPPAPDPLVLWVRLTGTPGRGTLATAKVRVTGGTYDDEANTPAALAPSQPPTLDVAHEEKDGSLLVRVQCATPPATARHLRALTLAVTLPAAAPAPNAAPSFATVEDVRASQGTAFGRPGHEEEWYKVEDFGPRQITMRRLVEAAPPLADLVFTNVRGDHLARNKLASASIADPGGGGWVAVLVFEDHVPLVVNVLIPTASTTEVVLAAGDVELP